MATTIKSRKKNQQKPVPTLLQAIEKVVELAEDSKMSEEFMLKLWHYRTTGCAVLRLYGERTEKGGL